MTGKTNSIRNAYEDYHFSIAQLNGSEKADILVSLDKAKAEAQARGQAQWAATPLAELIEQHRVAIAKRKRRITADHNKPTVPPVNSAEVITILSRQNLVLACVKLFCGVGGYSRGEEKWTSLKKPKQADETRQAANSHRHSRTQTPYISTGLKMRRKAPTPSAKLRSMWDSGQITADAVSRSSDSSEWVPLLRTFMDTAGRSQVPLKVASSVSTNMPKSSGTTN